MAQESELSLKLFASGYCTAQANVVNPKEGKGKTKFYAVWALFHIPKIGYIIFDTGYSDDFNKATHSFPERLYRWITPISLTKSQTAKSLLQANGIHPDDIKYVVISHFHGDHISALKDFTNAQFICTKAAYEQVLQISGIKAVLKGILHKLLPANFNNRLLFLENMADKIEINPFGITEYQLFGISQLKLVLLPGHAKGMLGFIYDHNQQSIFYATDASWSYETYQNGILPRKIVKLIFDSWDDFIETHKKIKSFETENPNYTVLFTHCPKTLAYLSNEI